MPVGVDEAVEVAAGLLVEEGVPAVEGTTTVMRRMRLLPPSAMYTLPAASSATPVGLCSVANVACPPSPLNELVPVPAIVEITPVDLVTRRMRWLL